MTKKMPCFKVVDAQHSSLKCRREQVQYTAVKVLREVTYLIEQSCEVWVKLKELQISKVEQPKHIKRRDVWLC